MNRNQTSEINPAMAASQCFESILQDVQASNLNYRIEMSPFSAVIYLKKSFVENHLGFCVTPPLPKSVIIKALKSENSTLSDKVVHLERVIDSMKSEYESVVIDNEECHDTINSLDKRSSQEIKSEMLLKTTQLEAKVKGLVEEGKNMKIKYASISEELKLLKQDKNKRRVRLKLKS